MLTEKKMKKTLKILNALADRTRLRAFLLLNEGELCVCELVRILEMKQSRISHVLRKLKEGHLVLSRKEGKWHIYLVNPSILNMNFIRVLLKDLSLSDKDISNYKKCKEEEIRNMCG
jgi:ArsR family transcriptional regulator